MTANPFAPLLDGVSRYYANGQDNSEGYLLDETDVLAALAAAVPDDLAEAGKVLEGVTPGNWIANGASVNTKPDESAVAVCVSMGTRSREEAEANACFIAWCREGVPALLARIAAQRSAAAWYEQLNQHNSRRAEAAETALAAMTKELETARLATGLVRLCVNCGKTRPADYGAATPRAGCPSPDACTWDMTPQEAADHWRKIAHDRYTAIAAERAKTAKLVEAARDAEYDLLQWLECGEHLTKAGFNMDGTPEVVRNLTAALREFQEKSNAEV